MRRTGLYVCACLALMTCRGWAGWQHPKPISVTRKPYSLVLRPGLGIELRVGERTVVSGSRLMLRGNGNKTRHYIASTSKTATMQITDDGDTGAITITDGSDSGHLRYQCRLELTAEGVFTYTLGGSCHGFPTAMLQQDLMLHPAVFAGAEFVADGPGGRKAGRIPPDPLPFNKRTLLSGQFTQCVFRTRLGIIRVHGSGQLNDFRSVNWLKAPGILYYVSNQCEDGDKVETRIKLQLPRPQATVPPKTVSLASSPTQAVPVPVAVLTPVTPSDAPNPIGSVQRYWALDVGRCFPHALAGEGGLGEAVGVPELPAPAGSVVRWIQGIPFRTQDRCLVLHGWLDAEGQYPGSATGIGINEVADRLCFLHACSGPVSPEAEAIRYVVHYQDGSKTDVPVLGTDIGGILSRSDTGPTRAILAVTERGNVLSAYAFEWRSPHPQKRISSLDVQSPNASHSPVLFAVTGAVHTRRPGAALTQP